MNIIQLPNDPTPEILAAILDARENTPFICRRKIDKSGYEVIRMNNHDWREVISDDQTVMGEFDTEESAQKMLDELVARWIYSAIISVA